MLSLAGIFKFMYEADVFRTEGPAVFPDGTKASELPVLRMESHKMSTVMIKMLCLNIQSSLYAQDSTFDLEKYDKISMQMPSKDDAPDVKAIPNIFIDIPIEEIRTWDKDGTTEKQTMFGFLGNVSSEAPKTGYGYPILIIHVMRAENILFKLPLYIQADHMAATGIRGPHGDNTFNLAWATRPVKVDERPTCDFEVNVLSVPVYTLADANSPPRAPPT